MTTEGLGEVHRDGDTYAVRVERRCDATPEEVWAAFTDPASIRRWLFADAVLEPRVGGRAAFTWPGEGEAAGEVFAWEPPRLLELTWAEGEGDTVVHVEINASGAGTLLVLEHRNLSAENAAGLGAGWHAHLVALRDVLGGREVVEDRWRPLFDSLRPGYVELVDAVP
jgi:uncharacterized protein YndB with AHSA1/START domain